MLVAVTIRNGGVRAVRMADVVADGAVGDVSADAPVAHAAAEAVGGAAAVTEVTGPAELAEWEQSYAPRWIFDLAAEMYPALLALGIRVRRCHDLALTERILLGREGRFGEPCRAAAILARAHGEPVPADPVPIDGGARPHVVEQPGLFDDAVAEATETDPRLLIAAYRDQMRRVDRSAGGPEATAAGIDVSAGALRLLIAAESGSALVAAEMSRRGLPWDADVHRQILADALGTRPTDGARPATLARLAEEISTAFGFPVNPDSPVDLREAFHRSGFDIETTRAWVLREIDHPAVAPLLRYKDLARLFTANGWNWLDDWVVDGRLAAQFLPGAVVSGRWATRGGGGLQLPTSMRRAAIAEPGHVLVVADAAQLEPRILAAVSKDPALTALSGDADLYAALAADGFGGDRRHAKLAMLGAMYGQTSGEAARLMATMRVRYPAAVACVESAARRGEAGGVVASVLGRACPPPSEGWRRAVGAGGASDESRARRVARDRGRFTRNFVIQASAADWAAAWMTTLRLALLDEVPAAEMVLFQHDELVIHVPEPYAEQVCELAVTAATTARDLVFPGSSVHTPVRPVAVRCYADAK
ncbi:MAG: bifunctional 3'-5' exonuclease/DNA polymerase [Actinobacteria bacterium 69-20]|nr:MAG: bifunctional 3'-5' exonuclease/DNA polymerase [Actinobacteria bacterium 69-20]